MQKAKFIPRLGTAAFLFLCFCGMYAFTVPELDMFQFAKDYRASASLWSEAFRYGNGRLLGNVTGFFFARHYAWAFLCMAVCMTAVVLLLNRIACGGSLKTVFALALVLAFPSAKMVQDVYGVFAAFANYVLPVLLFLVNVRLLQICPRPAKPAVRRLCCAAVFVLSAAACLCSENTTAVLCAFAVLLLLFSVRYKKDVLAPAVLHLTGTALGSVCMLLLPRLSHSAGALDDYRATVFGNGFVPMVKAVFGGVLRTCGVTSTFALTVLLLSAAFLLRLRGVQTTPAVRFTRAVLALYPLLSLLFAFSDMTVVFSRAVQAVQFVPTVLYAAALVIAVRQTEKAERLQHIGMGLLLLSSVVPMLFVSTYGCRTYYITWIILLLWACTLLWRQREAIRDIVRSVHADEKPIAIVLACVFAVMACVFAVQTAVNFDVHALRTQQIAEAAEAGETDVTVPLLPCRYVSGEEQWPYSVAMALPDDAKIRVHVTADSREFPDSEMYVRFARKNPLYALRYAAQSRRYMDPLTLANLLSAD